MRIARLRGLDGLALTDYETIEGYYEPVSMDSELLLLPRFESATDARLILVLGFVRLLPGFEEWAMRH